MSYWILSKNGKYISELDEKGYPSHTTDMSKALKFYSFSTATNYFGMGYTMLKLYC